MSATIFPARRPDGSLSVASRFSSQDDAAGTRVQDFVAGWLRGIGRYVDLLKDLTSLPRVEIGADLIDVIFDGSPTGLRWKDWMVFLTQDLAESVEGITFVCFYDLVADHPHPMP
jgi:hypothetical protein